MKIFEKIKYGPDFFDLGEVVGYVIGESKEQLKAKFGINHSFIDFREISTEEYNKAKENIEKQLQMFNIN